MTPEELVGRYQDRVYGLSLRLTGNPADAADLSQDAWLKAIAALPGFRGEAEAGTWLHRIVVNTWKNRVASARERWRRSIAPLDGVLDPGGDPPPERELERREASAGFAEAMARVTPDERKVLELRELEEKSYAEIARAQSVPIGTVKSRLHRARESLRDYVLCLGLLTLALLLAGRALKPRLSNVFNQIMGMVSGAAQGVASPR